MDTLYLPRPPVQQEAPRVSLPPLTIVFLSATIIFSLWSLFFLPVDFAALKMSLDPGFTIFFILVLLVFLAKMGNIIDFFLMLFLPSDFNKNMWIIHVIMLSVGAFFVDLSLIIVIIEIAILTNNFIAVISHPFFIDFFLFFITNLIAFLHVFFVSPRPSITKEPYDYVPVQPEPLEYPMHAFPQDFAVPQFPFMPHPDPQPIVQPPLQPQPQPIVQPKNEVFIPYYVPK